MSASVSYSGGADKKVRVNALDPPKELNFTGNGVTVVDNPTTGKYDITITGTASGSGEANTASSSGVGGVGIVLTKSGVNLPFKGLNIGSSKLSITDDTVNHNVVYDVVESNLTLSNIGGTLAYNKLVLTTSILNSDISTSAAIAYSKLGTNLKFSETGLTAVRTFTFPDASGAVVIGTDSRLSDARTPTAHASTHNSGGSDALSIDSIGAGTDITTNNVSITKHGLAPKLPNDSTQFLNGVGAYAVPPSSGEANTYSNSGVDGIGITLTKSGVNLPFKAINAGSAKITLTDDVTDHTIDIDVAESNLTLANQAGTLGYSKLVLTNSVVNADIAAAAAIAYTKLVLTGSIVNADINTSAAIAYSKLALTTSILNSDISATAAIAYSKLALAGSIVNADIATGAAIAYSKLSLGTSIVNSDISSSAAIAYSKLNLTGSIVTGDITAANITTALIADSNVTNAKLADNSILNAKINSAAAIAWPKISKTGSVLGDIGDINLTGLANGNALKWDSGTSKWIVYVPGTGGSGSSTLAGDTDVSISSPSNGQLLQYNGTSWVNATVGSAGEANTYSNSGADGLSIILTKSGVNLPFKGINNGSAKITLTDDTTDHTVDIDVSEADLTLSNIGGTANWSQVSKSGSVLADIADTTITTPAQYDVIVRNATSKWVNSKLDNNSISATAAIAYSKLNLSTSILNADVSASAAIAYSKLNLSTSIVNTDVSASAAIAYSKLNLSGSIVNADVATGAALAWTKISKAGSALADISNVVLTSPSSGNVLSFDGTNWINSAAGSGEANTMSNSGADGLSIVLTKSGVNLPVKGFNVGSSKLSITDDTTDHTIDYDVVEANLNIANQTGSIGDARITDLAYSKLTSVPSTIVQTNQANTYGANAQTFPSSQLLVQNPAGTFAYIIAGSAINTANKTVTLPQLTGNDQFTMDAFTTTLTNKTMDAGSNTFTNIANASISATAAIAYSKLNLATSIVNADISASAAIAYSKLSLGTSIVNSDISASAAIAKSKLASLGIVDADTGTFTTTKISTTSKSLLNSAIVYNDQANTFAANDQVIPSGNFKLSNSGFTSQILAGTLAANAVITLPNATTTLVATSDSRLSDSRTPTAHATTHKSGGTDSIKLDEFAATTDVTTLNASTSAHGLLPKLDNTATHYLDGTGAWSTPPGGGASTSSANTWSAIQTFNDTDLALRNPANTFSATVKAGAQTAATTFTFPVTTADTITTNAATQTLTNKTISGASNTLSNVPDSALSSNVSLLNSAQTITGAKTFTDTDLILRNPANTFSSTVSSGAQTASNTFTFPVTSSDTIQTLAATQTPTNKTINASNNTITDTSAATGDILKHNGTKFVRLAMGTANQALTVNSGGTDVAWASLNSERTGTATANGTGSQTSFTIAHGLGSTPYCAFVQCSSLVNTFTYTYDATNITVVFTTAPASGTGNVIFQWRSIA